MTKKKKRWIIIGAVLGGILVIIEFIIALTFPWNIIYLGIMMRDDPPMPEITYAEFPFEIVCEIDGKDVTVKDVYVCEYDGIGANEGVGKYIKWKGYVKGTGEDSVFIIKSGNKKIYCSIGPPEYYMDDTDCHITSVYPVFCIVGPTENFIGSTENRLLDEQELSELGIKLISYKLSDPIENSFGEEQE